MGCSASGFTGDIDDYPGANREQREAELDWEEGGDEYRQTGPAMGEEVLVAHMASDAAVRAAREKEWGRAVCDAYYQYMFAVEADDDDDDDWQQKKPQQPQPAGTDLEGPRPAPPAVSDCSTSREARGHEPSQSAEAFPAPVTEEQLQRLESHRKEVARMQDLRSEREVVRPRVLEDIAKRMMGLQDDPRVVLQVLQVPCEGGARPSDGEILKALRKALIKYHPDRAKQKGQATVAQEVEAEEIFKLLVRLRDELRDDTQYVR